MDGSWIPQASPEVERRFEDRDLTDRERDAVRSALRGMTAAAVAEVMGVSASTVGSLRQRAYRKLGVRGAAELGEKDEDSSADATPADDAARAALLAHGLSETQADVLALVAAGRSSAEIAEALSIAPGTVSSARANGYRMLGVHSREELTVLLAEEAAAPRRRRAGRLALVCVAAVVAVAVTVAVWQGATSALTEFPSDEGVVTHFNVNERGLTYGSIEDVEVLSPSGDTPLSDNLPDLIRVRGRSGNEGYVYSEDLLKGGTGREVPVFEKDGITVIDEFIIQQIWSGDE